MTTGKTITLALFVLLLLSQPCMADASSGSSNPNDNTFKGYFDDTVSTVQNTVSDFVSAGSAAGQGGRQTFNMVFDNFKPADNCGNNWLGASQTGAQLIIETWIAPTITAIMIIVIGIALIYMAGQFFSSPQLIAMAKDELFQTGLSVLRVMFIIALLLSGDTWYSLASAGSRDPIYSNNPVIIDTAMAFSRQMVGDMVTNYSMLLIYNMVIHTIYSATMWFGVTWRAMYSFNMGPMLKPIVDLLGSSLHFLSLAITEWLMHVITLCFIKRWMWTFFIPVGLLMRAFHITRNAGEALLALSFALAFIYPLMFLIDYEAHKIMAHNLVNPEKVLSGFINKSGIMNVAGPIVIVMMLMGGVFIPFFLGGALSVAFELVRNSVYYIVIIGLFLPFLNIFVTLTAAREIASFFRADVNFMSFLKII